MKIHLFSIQAICKYIYLIVDNCLSSSFARGVVAWRRSNMVVVVVGIDVLEKPTVVTRRRRGIVLWLLWSWLCRGGSVVKSLSSLASHMVTWQQILGLSTSNSQSSPNGHIHWRDTLLQFLHVELLFTQLCKCLRLTNQETIRKAVSKIQR
jgi:hypothetical protein